MAKLPFKIHGKAPFEDRNVFSFGKPAELYAADFNNGLARIGGFGRHPSYFFSYALAARRLIQDGEAGETYDDLGLPIFYLQRHATGLLLKRLLSWCLELVDVQLNDPNFTLRMTAGEIRRFSESHDLTQLHVDLMRVATELGHAPPPEIGDLVRLIDRHEITETFARYDRSKRRNADEISHVATESVLPVVELQNLLEMAAKVALFQIDEDDSFELELHNAWDRITHYEVP
jgi:hypothetical protein